MVRIEDCPYPFTELAERFPVSRGAWHTALVTRISEHGFRPPILVWRGEVLFGKEFLQAYSEAGVEPVFKTLPDDEEPLPSLIAAAIPALDLDNNARAVLAYLVSQWSQRGRPRADEEKSATLRNLTQEDAAKVFGAKIRHVTYVAQVLSEDSPAVPELRQAVLEWRIGAIDAAKVRNRPPEVQRQAVALVMSKKARTVRRAVEQVERDIEQQENAKKREAVRSSPIRDAVTLHAAAVEDLHGLVSQASVDAIITRVGATKDVFAFCQNLSAFAVHALNDTGLLAVIGVGQNLKTMLDGLSTDGLSWIDEWDLEFDGPPLAVPGLKYDVAVSRLPVLVFGKESFRPNGQNNRIQVPDAPGLHPGRGRSRASFEKLIGVFARPGQVICNPVMAGEHWPALLSWRAGMKFIGADASETRIAAIWEALDDSAIELGVAGISEDENLSQRESAPTEA